MVSRALLLLLAVLPLVTAQRRWAGSYEPSPPGSERKPDPLPETTEDPTRRLPPRDDRYGRDRYADDRYDSRYDRPKYDDDDDRRRYRDDGYDDRYKDERYPPEKIRYNSEERPSPRVSGRDRYDSERRSDYDDRPRYTEDRERIRDDDDRYYNSPRSKAPEDDRYDRRPYREDSRERYPSSSGRRRYDDDDEYEDRSRDSSYRRNTSESSRRRYDSREDDRTYDETPRRRADPDRYDDDDRRYSSSSRRSETRYKDRYPEDDRRYDARYDDDRRDRDRDRDYYDKRPYYRDERPSYDRRRYDSEEEERRNVRRRPDDARPASRDSKPPYRDDDSRSRPYDRPLPADIPYLDKPKPASEDPVLPMNQTKPDTKASGSTVGSYSQRDSDSRTSSRQRTDIREIEAAPPANSPTKMPPISLPPRDKYEISDNIARRMDPAASYDTGESRIISRVLKSSSPSSHETYR